MSEGMTPRAKFPSMCVQERLPKVVFQLQLLECKKYITSLEGQFQGKTCIGLQLDMWTNTDSVEREQYDCVIMTTVVEPMDTTAPAAQLHLHSDIVDFNVFPYSEKTGDNIKVWFLQVRIQNNIKHIMVRQHGDVLW